MSALKGLSLFASGGISELYLHEIKDKINIVLANELLPNRCQFYKHTHNNNIICGNICDDSIYKLIIDNSKELGVDFILATPPCQGMSKAGKMKFDDPRNILFLKILSIAFELNPKYILIENVPEFIKTNFLTEEGDVKPIMQHIFDVLGENYNINFDILNAQNFEVPQSRKRAILFISRKDMPEWKIPSIITDNDSLITVKQVIGHLPSLESKQTCKDVLDDNALSSLHPNIINWHVALKHNDNHILWLSHTPTGKSAFQNTIHFPKKDGRKIKGFSTTYKRIDWDKPSPTITMSNGSISSQNNVHPGYLNTDTLLWNNARALTCYELMLLTSIHPEFNIPSFTTNKLFRDLLGECVPPKFMFHLINSLPI